MRIENDNGTSVDRIYVRQSWLGDALMCPERARLGALHPELRRENDSAMMGTAVHVGIEAVLNGELDPQYIGDHSVESFRWTEKEMNEAGKYINVTNTDPKNWNKHIDSMANAWVRDIYPHVPAGGQTEFKFATKVADVENSAFQYELWFEGTMDYFHPESIWDWKTAARKYYEAEKQSQNIQSSVYAISAVAMGLTTFDVDFKFGVMIRNASSTGQVVGVTRTEGHGTCIVQQATSLVNTLLTVSQNLPSERWLVNDQHFLCSPRWCSVWSLCKGSHISVGDNNAEEAN